MGVGVHLYQMTCWESFGRWHTNDVKNLGGRSAKWYTPMRILGISVEEYFKKVMSLTGNIEEDLEKYMQIQNYEKEIEEHLKKINELSNKIDEIKKTLG